MSYREEALMVVRETAPGGKKSCTTKGSLSPGVIGDPREAAAEKKKRDVVGMEKPGKKGHFKSPAKRSS